MHRGRFIFAAALALVATSAYGAVTPTTLVNTDFTLQDPTRAPFNWQVNGPGGLSLNPSGAAPAISLQLTHNGINEEHSTAWTLLRGRLPSWTMWAAINIDKPAGTGCPADVVIMAFADVKPDARSDAGGGTGGGFLGDPDQAMRSITFEINTYQGNAIDTSDCSANHNVTFAFDDISDGSSRGGGGGTSNGTPDAGGPKVGQVEPPASLAGKIINGGWYRYQWNVDTSTGRMQAFISGLEDSNRAVQNQKLVEVTFTGDAQKELLFTGRWGVTAGTGGATENARVATVKIVTPAVDGPAATAGE
jgi:hypothetical protein